MTDRPGAGVHRGTRISSGSRYGVHYFIIDVAPGESVCASVPPEDHKEMVFQLTTEGPGTTLRVFNPYADVVTFDAFACLDEVDGFGCHDASTCPVGPGATLVQHWSEDLHRIRLSSLIRHAPGEVSTECPDE